MICRGRDRELALYVMGELEEEAALRLREHLVSCHACAAAEGALRRNARALGELGSVLLTRTIVERVGHEVTLRVCSNYAIGPRRARWVGRRRTVALALAASILICLALGGVWILTRPLESANDAAGHEGVVNLPTESSHTAPGALAAPDAGVNTVPSVHVNPSRIPVQLAKDVSQSRIGLPRKEIETVVVRLQTDDPRVILYWQIQNTGG